MDGAPLAGNRLRLEGNRRRLEGNCEQFILPVTEGSPPPPLRRGLPACQDRRPRSSCRLGGPLRLAARSWKSSRCRASLIVPCFTDAKLRWGRIVGPPCPHPACHAPQAKDAKSLCAEGPNVLRQAKRGLRTGDRGPRPAGSGQTEPGTSLRGTRIFEYPRIQFSQTIIQSIMRTVETTIKTHNNNQPNSTTYESKWIDMSSNIKCKHCHHFPIRMLDTYFFKGKYAGGGGGLAQGLGGWLC